MATPFSTVTPVTINAFIEEINQVETEVKAGKWKNKEDALSDKVNELLQKSQVLAKDSGVTSDTRETFKASLQSLESALNTLSDKTDKVKNTIKELASFQTKASGLATIDREQTKRLPHNNDKQIAASLATFRDYINRGVKGGPEALAEWVVYCQIPLEKLNLTAEERAEVLPHVTDLNISSDRRYAALSEKDLSVILSQTKNLQTLNLNHDEMKSLPELPSSLKNLTVSGGSLENIQEFKEGLESVTINSCFSLTTLPKKLPESMKEFKIIDCEQARGLPQFNANLKIFDSSGSTKVYLPRLMNDNLEVFKCRGNEATTLPGFSKKLVELDVREMPDLLFINKLPETLKTCDCSGCPSLESIGAPLPNGLSNIRISWSSNLKLPTELPPGCELIR